MVEKKWTEQDSKRLRTLEGALQLHLRSTKSKTVTYETLGIITSKMKLDASHIKDQLPSGDALSWQDRMWHDLFCVACGDDGLYRVTATGAKFSLELVNVEGSRPDKMRSLLVDVEKNGVDAKRSHEAMNMIKSMQIRSSDSNGSSKLGREDIRAGAGGGGAGSDQSERKGAHIDALLSPSESKSLATQAEPVEVRTDMSLEERVRARAEKKEANDKRLEEAEKDPVEDRLHLADALFDHASHILRRKKQGQQHKMTSSRFDTPSSSGPSSSPSNTAPLQTKCIMVFKDIDSLVKKLNRRRISMLMHDIKKIAPSFVSWDDPKAPQDKNDQIGTTMSKDTTVWIETSNFKTTRARLAGKVPPGTNNTAIATNTQKSASNDTPHDTSSDMKPVSVGSKRPAPQNSASATRPTKGKSFRTLVKKIKKPGKPILLPTRTPNGSTAHRPSSARPVEARQQTHLYNPPPALKRNRKRPSWSSDSDDEEVVYDGGDGESEPESGANVSPVKPPPAAKGGGRWRHLRINPNLILTDADYDGGTVIQPSFMSPRDLQHLFLKLNNGERI